MSICFDVTCANCGSDLSSDIDRRGDIVISTCLACVESASDEASEQTQMNMESDFEAERLDFESRIKELADELDAIRGE
jgi:hypothetical protein